MTDPDFKIALKASFNGAILWTEFDHAEGTTIYAMTKDRQLVSFDVKAVVDEIIVEPKNG